MFVLQKRALGLLVLALGSTALHAGFEIPDDQKRALETAHNFADVRAVKARLAPALDVLKQAAQETGDIDPYNDAAEQVNDVLRAALANVGVAEDDTGRELFGRFLAWSNGRIDFVDPRQAGARHSEEDMGLMNSFMDGLSQGGGAAAVTADDAPLTPEAQVEHAQARAVLEEALSQEDDSSGHSDGAAASTRSVGHAVQEQGNAAVLGELFGPSDDAPPTPEEQAAKAQGDADFMAGLGF